jgi:hypothetical protein
VAHILGIADTPLARIGRQVQILAEHQLTLLRYDPSDPDSYDEAALVARPGLVWSRPTGDAAASWYGPPPAAASRRQGEKPSRTLNVQLTGFAADTLRVAKDYT